MAMISRLVLAIFLGSALAFAVPQSALATLEGGTRPEAQDTVIAPPSMPTPQPVAEASTNENPQVESTDSETTTNTLPFSIIAEKNCFRLNPPPPPPTNNPAQAALEAQLPQVKITGFLKNKKGVRALFAVPPKDPKDTVKYFNLAEGERDDILEVVRISMETEEAEVLVNSSSKLTLSLKTNTLAAAAPQAPRPGVAPTPASPVPPTAFQPPGNPVAHMPPSSGRAVVVGGAQNAPPPASTQPMGMPGMAQPMSDGGLRSIPTRTLRVTPTPANTFQPQNIHQANQWMNELEHASQGNANLPPVPR